MNELAVADRRRKDRKLWVAGLVASLLVHCMVLFLGVSPPIPPSPFAAAGPKAADDRAAGGGMQALNVLTPPTVPLVPPEIPLPVEIEIDPVDLTPQPVVEVAAVLGEQPGLPAPPGLSDGDGQGDGGTAAEGLRRVLPPTPRGMIIPPANKGLRGVEVQVWVFVDERGQVVADSTRLDPPTRDRGFNRQLVREAAQWVFRPGTLDGKPIGAWFPYVISM